MNVLSLFSGIGGLDLGLERAGMTVVAPTTTPRWHTHAACRQHPAHWWDDAIDGLDEEPWDMARRHERAAAICAACPVQRQCEAERRPTDCGIWAGRLYKWHAGHAAAAARIWNPYAKGSDERRRRIAAMSAAGATAREIGRELGMHHRSVVRTRARIAAATREAG